jgi:integrase
VRAKLTANTLKTLKPKSRRYDVRDTEITGFLVRVCPSGVTTYFYQYRNEKQVRRHYRIGAVGTLSPQQARDRAKGLAGKHLGGIDVQAEKKAKRAKGAIEKDQIWGVFLEQQYKPWVLEHRRQGIETVRRLETNFGDLKKKPFTDINNWILEKWRTKRLKACISKSTLNRDVGDLKAALTKAVEWGLLDVSPLAKLKPFKLDQTPNVRYLSRLEEEQLRDALTTRDERKKSERISANKWRSERGYMLFPMLTKHAYSDYLTPLVLLAKNTGIRRGELFNLHWENVTLDEKRLTVVGAKTKSSQTRHISLNTEARKVLKSWQKQTSTQGLVFPSEKGTPLTNIKNSWTGLLKNARIKDFRFHDLRHDFASKLVMAGTPLNTVRDLLGHTDIKTTLRYAHLAPEHQASWVEKIN